MIHGVLPWCITIIINHNNHGMMTCFSVHYVCHAGGLEGGAHQRLGGAIRGRLPGRGDVLCGEVSRNAEKPWEKCWVNGFLMMVYGYIELVEIMIGMVD